MLNLYRNQVGASLVELMISMTLGLASLTAMASLVAHGIALNNQLLAKSRLDEEINALLAVVGQDIQRAGYQGLTTDMVSYPSTFTSAFHSQPVILSEYPSEMLNSCITFAYDRNQNGLLDTVTTNESYGYRLKDKALEMRIKGLSCLDSWWQDLSDPNIVHITTLSFSKEILFNQKVTQVRIDIFLQAHLVKYPNLSRSVRNSFSIKNYE